jgi:MazG family protein
MADDGSPIERLRAVMARLRSPDGGCPWDIEQTFATIAPYTIEEAYEVADAIESGEPDKIRDELGDLLFQVVFHARMAEERGWFDFDAVATAIRDKLVRRHPHVFAGAEFTTVNWEDQKAAERAASAERRGDAASILDDIPSALPALSRARKLGKRASRVGFDWPDVAGIREKLNEELAELDVEIAGRTDAVTEELGDALFTLVNLGRKLDVDAEEALRSANIKFTKRFKHMEALCRESGKSLETLSPAEWDALWVKSKAT